MEQVATTWVLYELTGSAVLTGLLGVSRAIPFLLLTPFAGALADRVDQRRLLLVTQSWGMLNSLVLGLLVLSGNAQPWHIYLQTLVQTGVTAFDITGRQSMFPRLVARRDLQSAVTLNSTAARTAGFVGPAVGGWLIISVGNAAPFLANAASFLALIGMLLLMRHRGHPARVTSASFRVELLEGLRYVARSPLLSGILKLETVVALFSVNPAILAIFAREVLHSGAGGLGVLLSAMALGALLGNFLLLWFSAFRHKGRLILIGGALYAVCMIGLAATSTLAVAAAVLLVAGMGDSAISAMRNAALHLAARPGMRGRTVAAMLTIRRGVQPFSQTQSGAAAGLLGAPAALGMAGAVMLVSVAVATMRGSALRDFTSDADVVIADDDEAQLDPRPI
jgi:MFS family permease